MKWPLCALKMLFLVTDNGHWTFWTSLILSPWPYWVAGCTVSAITLNFFLWYPNVFHRDGPDQNSPQLGVFSGNTALETAYSSTNQVLLKFHSDFSNGGFFVLNFHGQFISASVART